MSAQRGSGRRRRKTPWRENVEALVVAVVMAVFLKYFVVEAYKIPTGSMQPTLMGQAFGDGGGVFDRILVDKLSFHLRAPRRFEVVVFKYPLDRSKNFVKRLWGLPGELLRVEYGDVWVSADGGATWRIPRRPRGVQRAAWKALDRGPEDALPSWRALAEDWRAGDRQLVARGAGRAEFVGHGGGPIVDRYLDGYPRAVRERVSPRERSGFEAVGDLRVEGRVRALPGCLAVAVELEEGGRLYRLELPGPAAPEGAAPRVEVVSGEGAGREAAGEPWRLPAGRWVRFGAENLDDRLTLEAAGEPRAELEVAPAADQASRARLALEGEGADFEQLQVLRDIYYTAGNRGGGPWSIPEDHYFMLGDNTQDSSDSREWTFWNMLWDGEDAPSEPVRGNWRPAVRGAAPLDANPVHAPTPDGPTTWFRDEWGEVHVFPSSAERTLPPAEATSSGPFVPRKLITGRAVLVFWPIAPRLGLWRLRWVR